MKQIKIGGVWAAVLGAVSWGFSGTASQFLFMNYDISPQWLTSMRMTLSGLVLTLICLLFDRTRFLSMPAHRRDFGQEILFAIAGLMFVQITYLTTIRYSNSATATVLQNLSVAMIAVCTAFFNRRMLSPLHTVSVLLALFGVFLLATHGDRKSMVLSPQALLWGLGSAVGVCTYSLLSAGLLARWPSRVVTAYGMLIGGIALGLLSGAFWMHPALDLSAVLVLILIVLIGTVGAFTLFIQSIGEIGPVKATLIGCLEPVSATVISVFWLGSRFSAIDLLGFACILATVFLFNRGKEN